MPPLAGGHVGRLLSPRAPRRARRDLRAPRPHRRRPRRRCRRPSTPATPAHLIPGAVWQRSCFEPAAPTEAHPIFAEVKAETPDDVWLYNNAGLEYGAAGDHERAVAWLTEGLELALATGDPERLVAQMSDLRRESLAALGRQLDELEARADEFLAQPQPPKPAWQPQRATGRARRSAMPPRARPSHPQLPSRRRSEQRQDRVLLALGWFPPRGVRCSARGLARSLPTTWGTADHTEYNRRLQRHLAEMPPTSIGPTLIAPIRLDRLRSWCSRTGNDPASGSARSSYAAELARTARPASSPGRRLATHPAGAPAAASTSSAAGTRASLRHQWCS